MRSSLAFYFIVVINIITAQPYVDIVNLQVQQFGFDENTTTELTANLFLPLEIKNENFIILGASYNNLSFDPNTEIEDIPSLTAITIQLGGIKKWNESWSTMAILIPRIRSDYEDISKKDYQLGAASLMIKTVNDNFKYKFGLYYNREFFGNFFMPLLGLEWKASENLQVFGVIPGSMNVEYKLNDKFYTGLAYKSITASYRLSEESGSNYVRDGHESWGHNQLKTYVNYYPQKRIVLSFEIGHTMFRQFNIIEDGTKNKIGSLEGFGNQVFCNVGIAYRVRLDVN